MFAREGYERTSIRAIAAAARIDPSMVMRYYGSKDGLFAAASVVDLRLPDFSGVDPAQLGQALVGFFLVRWECDTGLQALLRTAATNEEIAAKARGVFSSQFLPLVGRLAPDQHDRRAALLATQMLGLALCRYILRLPGIAEASADQLTADIGPNAQRYLLGEL